MEQINFEWQIDAACQNLSTDLFFIEHGKRLSQEAVDACHGCTVREECLNHALKYEEYGYWGGKTPAERKTIRKQLGIKLVHPQSIADVFSLPVNEDNYENLYKNIEDNKPCGTVAAHQRHKRRGEPMDQACLDAYEEYKIALNARRRAPKKEML